MRVQEPVKAVGGGLTPNPGPARGLRRVLWTTTGTFFLCLGIVGIAIPLLPTTPFLLLAAACYLRGSERMHTWMLTNKVFGAYLSNYVQGRGIPRRVKIGTVSLLWAVIGLSAVLGTDSLIVRTILLVIAVAVSLHVLRLKAKVEGGAAGEQTVDLKHDSAMDSREPSMGE